MKRILLVWGAVGLILFLGAGIGAAEPPVFIAEQVVVTGWGFEEPLEKSATSVTVLKVEKLKKQGLNYVGQALAAVGGADLKSSGSLGQLTTLNLRGSRSEQVLVLLDGQKINSSQNGIFDFSAMPLDNLERIEIVKFPLSALYGADALGGVVNLISKNPQKRRGAVSFLAGSFGERKYQLDYGDRAGGIGYQVNLNLLDADGFRPNSDFHGKNYSFKLNLPENFLKTSVSYFYQKTQRGVPGSIVYPSETARQDDENNLISVGTDFAFPNGVQNKANFYFNQFWQNYADPVWFSFSEHKNKNYGFDYLNNFRILENQTFSTGLSWRQELILSSDVGDHSRNNLAVIFQDDVAWTENLGMILGGRLEQFSNLGKVLTPRVGGRWGLAPDWNLKASWSRGFRAPTFNELYWPESFWAGGNPNLKPEEGEAYDFELTWRAAPSSPSSGGQAAELKLAGFLGKTFNLINWASDAVGVWRPQNLASVDKKGLEFSVLWPFNFGDIFSNVSWQNVTDTSTGFEVTYLPHYKANMGVHLKNSDETLGGDVTLRYVGWRYADNNTFAQRTMPSFLVTDLKTYFKISQWTARIGLNNLFDAQYQEVADYPTAGRTFWASIGQEF